MARHQQGRRALDCGRDAMARPPAIDIVSAMNDPALFSDWFQRESWDGWRAVLKAAYALAELAPAALRRSANKRSSDDIS